MKTTETREAAAQLLGLKAHDCRWPVGDPRKPGFYFCAEPAVLGEVYCSDHCLLAYPIHGRHKAA